MRAERPSDGPDDRGAPIAEGSSEEGSARPSLISRLAEAGVASELELWRMAAEAAEQEIPLGELVVARGLLDEEGLGRLVAGRWGLPFLARGSLTIDPAAASLLPLEQAGPLGGCVIGIRERAPLVVIADPSEERLDALRAHLDTTPARPPASFAVVTASSLDGLLHQLARLRPSPTDPDPTPLATNPAGQIGPPAHTDLSLAERELASATEEVLLARLAQLERDRRAAGQQLEHLQQQLRAGDQQRADEREHSRQLQASRDRLQASLDSQHNRFNHLSRRIPDLRRKIHELLSELDNPNPAGSDEMAVKVPLIDLRLLEGVFSPGERRQLADSLIRAVVGMKGDSFRSEIELLIAEGPGANRYEREALPGPEEGDEPP